MTNICTEFKSALFFHANPHRGGGRRARQALPEEGARPGGLCFVRADVARRRPTPADRRNRDYLVACGGARQHRLDSSAARARHCPSGRDRPARDRVSRCCEHWIDSFREWAIEVPIVAPKGAVRARAPGTVEASVRQLAAVINYAHNRKDTLFAAAFSAKSPDEVSRTPVHRADLQILAAMFRYCVDPQLKPCEYEKLRERRFAWRADLHRFLQISVATWARPDATHEVDRPRSRPVAFQCLGAQPQPARPRTDEEISAHRADRPEDGKTARFARRILCRR